MDQQSVNEEDLVDLELGENGCQNDSKDEPITGNRRTKSMLRLASGVLNYDASAKGDYRTNSYDNSGSSSGNPHGNIELFIDSSNVGARDHMPLIEKSHAKEKCKTMKPKKSSKPPRPPKGPILDTADMKLMKEFSELAMKKRARVERMKTLKKLKAAKSSLASSSSSSMSSGSSLTSMVITILFFLIIIYQGVLPKYFSSEWSVAQFHLVEGSQYIVAFGQQKNTVVILGLDGSFYRCKFDPTTGGEMTQLEYHNFLKPEGDF